MSRRGLQAVVCTLLLAALGGIGRAGSAAGAGTVVADTPAAIVRLDGVTPGVPGPDDTLAMSGTVTNDSAGDLTALNVYLQLSRVPLRTVDDLARMDDPDFRPGVRTTFFVPADDLAPGASTSFHLDVAVADLDLTETGVYVVGVVVRAFVPGGGRDNVGSAMTVLPYVPDPDALGTVGVAWVWPLTAPVARAEDGTFLDDELGAAMEPTGQLGAAFIAADDTPVTWLVDPAVAEAAADMADGYLVGSGSTAQPGAHERAAGDWLTRLRAAATSGNVALLPYANVDAVALTRASLVDDLALALAARTNVDRDLVPGATENIGVAPGGFLDAPTLEAFGAAGVDRVLVATAGLDTPSDPHAARATIRLAGRTYDAIRMATPITSPTTATPVQQRQLLLAQTALAAAGGDADATSAPSTLVLTPPPGRLSGLLVGSLLDVASSAPWVRPATLADATGGGRAVEGFLAYPEEARADELPADYLNAVTMLRARIDLLAALTNSVDDDTATFSPSSPSSTASPSGGATTSAPSVSATPTAEPEIQPALARELAVLRVESAAWRVDISQARTAVATWIAALDREASLVHIASTGSVTLSSSRGRFPLTVQNELDEAVTVRIDLRPQTPTRLRMTDVPEISIAAGQLATVDVEAEAGANGTFVIDVQLVAPNGAQVGPPTVLTLRATDYDTVAWIVIMVAGGLLFAASGVRLTRRIVRARRG